VTEAAILIGRPSAWAGNPWGGPADLLVQTMTIALACGPPLARLRARRSPRPLGVKSPIGPLAGCIGRCRDPSHRQGDRFDQLTPFSPLSGPIAGQQRRKASSAATHREGRNQRPALVWKKDGLWRPQPSELAWRMDSGTRDPCSAFLGENPSLSARRGVHRQDRSGSGGRSHMGDPKGALVRGRS